MIVSVHIADVGAGGTLSVLRRQPQPARVPGLSYAETVITAPLGKPLLPPKNLGRVGMIAGWDDDDALDAFSRNHPLGELFAAGWEVRLQPLRVSGFWAGMPGLPSKPLPVDDEPVAVLTLGRLRLLRAVPFRRSAVPAEGDAIRDEGLVAGTGLGRPPRLVSTFSLWRSAAAMREYAYAKAGTHQAAVGAERTKPFHHESAFVRFRPYASRGSWNGRNPLAVVTGAAQTLSVSAGREGPGLPRRPRTRGSRDLRSKASPDADERWPRRSSQRTRGRLWP